MQSTFGTGDGMPCLAGVCRALAKRGGQGQQHMHAVEDPPSTRSVPCAAPAHISSTATRGLLVCCRSRRRFAGKKQDAMNGRPLREAVHCGLRARRHDAIDHCDMPLR
ncbi:uncharacterized protein PV09_04528 [Verruconis gallopava]|uniref:Uncharacterized protein n=1 Tax=Verruconis gallopava TaxID=253628 RepID=A0A0D1XNR8_9PEZI|nr:uncharacterized protein PV09_04528 [Verruconis gallopava]KIW04221.1 hypothetical protein PV09_04528 [Verruconis gallopava]